MTCPPCNQNCSQGDNCDWEKLTPGENIGLAVWIGVGLFLFFVLGLAVGAVLGGHLW